MLIKVLLFTSNSIVLSVFEFQYFNRARCFFNLSEQIRRRAERELEIVYSTIFVENFTTPTLQATVLQVTNELDFYKGN